MNFYLLGAGSKRSQVEATGMVVNNPLEQVSKIKEQRSNCIIKISVQMKKECAPINRGAFIYMILIYYLDLFAND